MEDVAEQGIDRNGRMRRWRLDELHDDPFRILDLEPSAAVGAPGHGLGNLDIFERQIFAQDFGIGGVEGDVIHPARPGIGI